MNTHTDQHEIEKDTVNQSGSSPRTGIKEKGSTYKSVSLVTNPTQTQAHQGSHSGLKISQSLGHSKVSMQSSEDKGRWYNEKGKNNPSYPLERPVKTSKSCQEVTANLDNSLRERSVQATFIPNEARAVCVTSDFLKYYVNLYCDTDGSTLVEVQRRKGCSLSFRNERVAILCAVEGKSQPPQNSPMLTIPPGLIEEMGGYPTTDEIKAIIDNCVEQLHRNNHDGKLVAFQHLASMTDSTKSSADSADKAALIIMDPENGTHHVIMTALVTGGNSDDEFFIMIANACLTIFANCLSSLSQNDDDYERLCHCDNWLVKDLLPSLVCIINKTYSLHNSHLAMKCLRILLAKSPKVLGAVKGCTETRTTLEAAVAVGKKNHALLEKEARSTMRFLE